MFTKENIDFNKEVEVETRFGVIYIESLNYNNNNSCDRDEEERIKIYDSDHNYLDYYPMYCLYDLAEMNGTTVEDVYVQFLNNFENTDKIENISDEIEWYGSKENLIKYLTMLGWAEEEIWDYDYLNRIGDNYLLMFE